MKRGFTLIEMLITVVVVGILATIGIGGYQTILEKSKMKACAANIEILTQATKLYSVENDMLPASLAKLDEKHLKKAYAMVMKDRGILDKAAHAFVHLNNANHAYAIPKSAFNVYGVEASAYNCPKDVNQNGSSYGLNSNLAGFKWKDLPPDMPIVGDITANSFDNVGGLSARHKPQIIGTPTAQVGTKASGVKYNTPGQKSININCYGAEIKCMKNYNDDEYYRPTCTQVEEACKASRG